MAGIRPCPKEREASPPTNFSLVPSFTEELKLRGERGVVTLSDCSFFIPHSSLLIPHFSFNRDEEIVFLSTLHEEVFAVDEVVGSDGPLLVVEFLLVQRYTATLHHFAHLTL